MENARQILKDLVGISLGVEVGFKPKEPMQ